jgi:hypothetical protein
MRSFTVLVVSLVLVTSVSAQQSAPAPESTALDFSGMIFANYQYRGDKGPSKAANKFDVERAYLTFRMPAGERVSIRITTDIFQQATTGSDAFYRGWVIRAKYAYLQYNYLSGSSWRGAARFGILQTVFIDHEEGFWSRWLSLVPVERAGYFSSADAGASTLLSLPRKLGEVYVTLTNGPGYTSRETDRFKDYAARFSFQPLSGAANTYIRALTLSAWGYKGALGSRFIGPDSGQLGPVSSSLRRDRWGIFFGVKDPRLVVGADYAKRNDEGEIGANSSLSPRSIVDSVGRLTSFYVHAKPFLMRDSASHFPLGVVLRWDQIKPDLALKSGYYVVIAGLTFDLSRRASASLDYQEQTPRNGSTIASSKTYYAHFVANF